MTTVLFTSTLVDAMLGEAVGSAKHRQLYPKLRFIHTMYGVGYYYAESENATPRK